MAALEAESLNADSVLALTWGKQFAGIDLSQKNFIDANLARANFFESNLAGANLTDPDCFEANFNLSNLEGAKLTNVDMYQAQLIGANMSDANCAYVFFGYAKFIRGDRGRRRLRGLLPSKRHHDLPGRLSDQSTQSARMHS